MLKFEIALTSNPDNWAYKMGYFVGQNYIFIAATVLVALIAIVYLIIRNRKKHAETIK
ncbi:hypothetical protein [Zunongwangia sp. H14]|uniref:hypothetical protein n=1 Tax=Zunongwangia sp. H14 TaxID=3240792 RepID=UPI0035626DA0